MSTSAWWLTLRLWRGGSWRQVLRLALLAVGVAAAVLATLLGTIGPRVQQAQADVVAERTPVSGDRIPGRPLVQVSVSTIALHGHRYDQYRVYAESSQAGPRPQGLTRWPEVGHSIVSDFLRHARPIPLRSSLGRLDADTLPRSLTASPREYVSYTRVAEPLSPTSGPEATVTVSFGRPAESRSSTLWVLVEMTLLIMVPALVMMLVMLRLVAGANHARTVGLFRAGVDPATAARLTANDVLLPAAAGCALGLIAASVVVPLVQTQGWLGMSWWPEQTSLSWPELFAVFIVVLLVARTASRRATRRAVQRSSGPEPKRTIHVPAGVLGWGSLIMFAISVGFLAALVWYMSRATTNTVGTSGSLEILVSAAVIGGLVSIVGLGRVMTVSFATLLARTEALPLFLGGRAARHRLPAMSGLTAVVAIVITLFGTVTGFLGVVAYLVEGNTERAPFVVHYENVGTDHRPELGRFVGRHHGVAEAAIEIQGHPMLVAVGSCRDLREVAAARAEMNLRGCTGRASRGDRTQWAPPRIRLPGLGAISLPNEEVPGAPWDIILPPTPRNLAWATVQSGGEASFVASREDGSFSTLLAQLQEAVHPSFVDADVKNPDAVDAYVQQRALVRSGLVAGLALMLMASVMTGVELRWQARPSGSTMAAGGLPQRTMRLASATQFVVPVLATGVPAVLLGTVSGSAFMAIGVPPREVFTAATWLPPGVALVVCLTVAAIAGYTVGGARFTTEAQAGR